MISISGIIENIINPPEKIVVVIDDFQYIRFLNNHFQKYQER